MAELQFLYLTWDDIQQAAEKTADMIKEDGFEADIIIAVSRGGFDPARIISDQKLSTIPTSRLMRLVIHSMTAMAVITAMVYTKVSRSNIGSRLSAT